MIDTLLKHWRRYAKTEYLVYKHVPSETDPSGVVDVEIWNTSLGPIGLSGLWAFGAEKAGVHPQEFDTYGRQLYYEKHLRSEELFSAMMLRFPVEREVPRLWMETLHAKHICQEIIDRDAYGTQALHDIGFRPSIIVDVGAHVGTFSLRAHSLWPYARIIALEPRSDHSSDPNNLHLLAYNVKAIPEITVVHTALIGFFGEADNEERMRELEAETFKHWVELGLRGHPKHASKTTIGGHSGMSVRSLLQTYNIDHIDLFKLDCEGAEINILRECKALGLLPRIQMIRGEWHGEIAKTEIPHILSDTHRVGLHSLNSSSGLLQASLR